MTDKRFRIYVYLISSYSRDLFRDHKPKRNESLLEAVSWVKMI